MRKKVLVLLLTVFCFSAIPASAETTKTKPKNNFVSKSEFQGHNCCQISRVGGWTKYNARKRVSKKEIAAPEELSKNENNIQDKIED